MRFIYTRHAVEKMLEPGVSRREVEEAVARGMKFGPDSRGHFHARMAGVEVVYARAGEETRVITVFPAGGKA